MKESDTDTRLDLPRFETVQLRFEGGALHVTLDRPEVKNAVNLEMVSELTSVFDSVRESRRVRVVVLRGAGGCFSAGGDVGEMRAASEQAAGDADPLIAANRSFGALLGFIDRAPQAVVSVVEGTALGGGLGLVCVSDLALTVEDCRFGMPESRLGLVPAQIAPFVVRRIGLTQTRRLAVTGAAIKGREAERLGLVHQAVADGTSLEASLVAAMAKIHRCGPEAIAATKELLHAVGSMPQETLLDAAARVFTTTARGPEALEGMAAFEGKRLPSWAG